jgi:hypothetical protein
MGFGSGQAGERLPLRISDGVRRSAMPYGRSIRHDRGRASTPSWRDQGPIQGCSCGTIVAWQAGAAIWWATSVASCPHTCPTIGSIR